MKLTVFSALPLLEAVYSPSQLDQARRHLRDQLHHIGAEGELVDEFVEKLIEETLADTDNQHSPEDWTETETRFSDHRGDVIRTEFLSPSFKLMTGGAHFTLNPLYHVPMPKGDYMILNQTWDIVRDDGATQVPLTDMYNHHWLVGSTDLSPLDMCEDDFFFGGGAEYRNMDYSFPAGYGMARVGATGECGANLHFINTEDLKTQWKGFNNPDGDHGAALKLACECGYEPERAVGPCEKWGDGSFLCCFTGSRARVNHPLNRTKSSYRLKATFEYKRDFSGTKPLRVQLLDIGGNLRVENGQVFDAIAEWAVEANLNNEGVFTRCNETVCTATRSQKVEDGSNFGYGICPGDMLWSYVHFHAGGIGGSMAINGKEYCRSHPVVGTDASNPPGNEQGFLVGVTECVDDRLQGNKVRLEKGDMLTLTTHYDVDPNSQRHFPMPGGKHGGIMALFFAVMECDAGSWDEIYVRRNDTCVGVPESKAGRVGTFYETKDACEKAVDEVSQLPPPVVHMPAVPAEPVELAEPAIGQVDLLWRDCGLSSKLVNFTHLSPATAKLGGKTDIRATGNLSRSIESANLTVKMASGALGLTLFNFDGEFCSESHGAWTLLDQIHLKWKPLGCPLAPGDFLGEMELWISPVVPKFIAHTTTTLVLHDQGEELACLEVITQAGGSEISV